MSGEPLRPLPLSPKSPWTWNMGNIIFWRGEFSSIFGCTAQGSRGLLLLSVLHETTPFLTASKEGSSDGCPVGSHVLKKKRRRWREEIQFQGMYVHEEQEDAEIVKVDCMCVKKE